ncbi:cytochrome P450 94B3 [Telopea speciosissima]|uniref:cytochrome P450 94B3 n=1 Tax=Telopea speciosissima TaxID=54955 RepID=UPI001CC3E347|nr:cytochrome P450 94B3 [Telopea speciosissima]
MDISSTFSSSLTLFLLLSALFILFSWLFCYYHSLIKCLISFYKNRTRLLDWFTNLLIESPTHTIVVHRFGAPRTIITANPGNVEYILKTHFANFPKGKPFTEILGDFLGRGIFNVDGELWHTQRKLASYEFTAKSLREFLVSTLEEEMEKRLFPILESAMDTGRVIDLQELLGRFTFDTVCKLSLGHDPCFLDREEAAPPLLAEAFDVASEISARRGAAPVFVVWKMKRALCIGSERKLKKAIRQIHVSVQEMINEKKMRSDGVDLLSRLIQSGLDDEVIRDMAISFIMAGKDTTSAAMTWLFWLLSRHPDVEEELVNEIEEVVVKGNGGSFGYEELKEMRFLQASLCESMRLYPPVAWDSKHAVADDKLPDGTNVRKGDRVTYFPYGMGRMEALWGKDRLEFRPDRWLDTEGSGLKKVSPFKFPVFQAGPRVCLGKEMAFIQMKYVMASILSRFRLRPVRSDQPKFVPLLTAHMAGGFKVQICSRDSSSLPSSFPLQHQMTQEF